MDAGSLAPPNPVGRCRGGGRRRAGINEREMSALLPDTQPEHGVQALME